MKNLSFSLLFSLLGLAVFAQNQPVLVKDIYTPNPKSSNPTGFVATPNRVFFATDEDPNTFGYILRKTGIVSTDGTAAGTSFSDQKDSFPTFSNLFSLGNDVYYLKKGTFSQNGLYKISPPNLSPILIDAGAFDAVSHKNKVFFTKNGQIWQTDGTPAGTQIYYTPLPAPEPNYGQSAGQLASNGDSLYFINCHCQKDGPYSTGDLWSVSGNAFDPGTLILKNAYVATNGGGGFFGIQADLSSVNGRAILTTVQVSGGGGNHFLGPITSISPGYPAINTGSTTTNGGHLNRYASLTSNRFVVLTNEELHGFGPPIVYKNELWSSNTGGTSTKIKTFAAIPTGIGKQIGITGNDIYFAADDGLGSGQELWRTDGGSASSTIFLKDINPGAADSKIGSFAASGNVVYFSAFDGTNWSIWKSDGNQIASNSTSKIANFPTTSPEPPIGQMLVLGNTLYFSGNDGTTGFELWKMDLTSNPPATCTGNILTNPDFQNQNISGWEGAGIYAENMPNGRFLSVCTNGTAAYQTKPATAGKTYNLTVQAFKSFAGTTGVVRLKFLSNTFQVLSENFAAVTSLNYAQILMTKIAPAGTAFVEVGLIKDTGAGCVNADDWCLTDGNVADTRPDIFAKGCSPVNGIFNGNFTNNHLTAGGQISLPSCSMNVGNLVPPTTTIVFKNKVYLSIDAVVSPDDLVLITQTETAFPNNGPVNYFAEISFSSGDVPANVPTGNYFVITKTDADNEITESDETNNTNVYPVTLTGTAPPPTVCSGNFLLNSGFESDFQNWDGNGGQIATAPDVSTGQKSLKMCTNGEVRRQTLPATAGKNYKFQYTSKTAGANQNILFGLKFLSNSWQVLGTEFSSFDSPTGFSTNFIQKTAPAGTAWVEVSISKQNSGCVFVDDLCLTDGGTPPNPCSPDVTPPTIAGCPASQNVQTAFPNARASWTDPTVSDACGLATLSSNFTSGSTFPLGTTVVKYTATDVSNNITTCSFTITAVPQVINPTCSGSLLVNSDFEILPGWVPVQSLAFSNFGINGSSCGSMSLDNTFISQKVAATAGKDFNFKVWLSSGLSHGSMGARISLRFLNAAQTLVEEKTLDASALPNPYLEFSITKTAPVGTAFVEAIILRTGGEFGYALLVDAACLTGTSMPPPPSCTGNLLQNPGFESDFQNWDGNGGQIATSPDVSVGQKSLKMCSAGETRRQTLAATAGKNYKFQWAAKTAGTNQNILFGLKFLSNSWQVLGSEFSSFDSPTGFMTNFIQKTAPAGTAWVEVSVNKQNAGCVFVDDFCLSEVGGSGNCPNPLVATVSPVQCFDNGTPDNPNDDLMKFSVTATGGAAGPNYFIIFSTPNLPGPPTMLSVPKGVPHDFSYSISAVNQSFGGVLNIGGEDFQPNQACNFIKTIPVPATCSNGGGGADLKITISADKTTVPQWGNVNFTVTAKNEGNATISQANILVWVCPAAGGFGFFTQNNGLVYASTPPQPSLGKLNSMSNLWEITNLAPGQTGILTLPLFTLTTSEKKVVAWSALQSPTDPDSQPNASMPANCTPAQDDEAVWTINVGQTLLAAGDRKLEIGNGEIADFQIFPNPAGASVFVKIPATETGISVSIFNQIGILEKVFSFQKMENEVVELDLSEVKNGVYFLKIETAGQRSVVKKMVVSRMD